MRLTVIFVLLSVFALSAKGQTVIPTTATTSQATLTPLTVPSAYPSSTLVNYVRTWTAQRPVTDPNQITTASSPSDFIQQTAYLDGLGRPLQSVSKGITPTGKDLVAPVIYDQFGREQYKYLPYVSGSSDGNFKNDPFTEQASFMQSQYASQGETFFYGQSNYEASPLNRVLKTMAPGNSWTGSNRGAEISYEINDANEVLLWNVDFSSSAIPIINTSSGNSSYYDAGQLYRTVTKDEHGKRVVEYKDKEGQVLLKKVELTDNASIDSHEGWLCTYYIYDDLNRLRYVIQPKAVEEMRLANNWTLSPAEISELCFHYEYDQRNRMILKKVPGAAEVYMVYDPRDRLVYSQDGNMRAKNWWEVTIYDALNRPATSGIMVYSGSIADLQTYSADPQNLSGGSTILVQGSSLQSDLVVTQRQTTISDYQATESIEFTGEFTSETGAEFTAEIVNSTQGIAPSTQQILGTPIPANSTFTPLTFTYYDDYSTTQKTYDNSNNAKLDGGNNPYPEIIPAFNSNQTKGMVTSSKVWVLENPNDLTKGRWLETVSFYDDKGRVVQMQSENITGGKESITTLYNFANKAICTYQTHQNIFSEMGMMMVKTNLDYDGAGRLLTIKKQLNDDLNLIKTIVQNEYDELGQLKNKKLGTSPNTSNTPLENLVYDYNIRGWLKDINKEYVNSANSQHYFGQSLSYDYGFSSQQYNGNISGINWRSKGDGEQRAYGFQYDNANRLTNADFTQYTNSSWNTSAGLDFSVSNLRYDANGNILSQQQNGWKLTGSTPIDKLTYTYQVSSNKLQNVIDDVNDPTTTLGDFRTSALHPQKQAKDNYATNHLSVDPSTITDYTYDDNGNLQKDLNKDIQINGASGIVYNHLNLPQIITVNGKGTITYTYDALGNKLQKKVHDITNPQNPTDKTTTYMGAFVYENNELQFISHEEGRLRPVQVRNPNWTGVLYACDGWTYYDQNGNLVIVNCAPQPGEFLNTFVSDYFIKDHLGNVRMVLTDEQKTDQYPPASMEYYSNNRQNDLYGQVAPNIQEEAIYTNIAQTRTAIGLISGYPSNDQYTSPNDYVAKVSGNGNKIGPAIVLKVMAGDQFNIRVSSWYKTTAGNPILAPNPITDLASILATNLGGIAGGKATVNSLQSSGVLTSGVNSFLTNQIYNPNRPKAYLNWIFFDEQFHFVQSGSGSDPVPDESVYNNNTSNASVYQHILSGLPVTRSGYLYVYVSNETPNIDVFFDNLQVTHIRGPLISEDHYYPFGERMFNICSESLNFGSPGTQKKKYNGIDWQNDLGLNEYDAQLRTLDPQVGRWWQIDPKVDNGYENISPYASNYNDPLRYSDPLGDEGTDCCWDVAISFVKGVGQELKSTGDAIGQGIANTVLHPISTIKGIGNGLSETVSHPINTLNSIGTALGNAMVQTTIDYITGDANTKANMLGRGFGIVLETLVGAEASKGISIIKGTAEAETVANASKVESLEQSAAKISKDLNGGKARVELHSENEMKRIDLTGDSHTHNGTTYTTPHTSTAPRNYKAPINKQPAYNSSRKHIEYHQTTKEELRMARKYLKNNQ